MTTKEVKQKSSFANLTATERQVMAARGGRTAHQLGRAHRFTTEEARAAALKGVEARRANAVRKAGIVQQNAEVRA